MKNYITILLVALSISQSKSSSAQVNDLETHDMLVAYCQMQSGIMEMSLVNKFRLNMNDQEVKSFIINKMQSSKARIFLPNFLRDLDTLLNFYGKISPKDRKNIENDVEAFAKSVSNQQYQDCLSKLP